MQLLNGGLNLATMVIGFGMSATFVVLICVRVICGRSRSAASHSDLELRTDLAQPEHTISGLEPIVVAAFPTMIYNHAALHSSEISLCSICLGEYQDKEVLRVMPTCGHSFHLDCIDVWLQKQSTCPICRLSLNDFFKEKIAASSLLHFLQAVDSPFSALDHPS